MIPHRPFHITNPEFTVHTFPGHSEYRNENRRLARDGSGRVINGTSGFGWLDAFAFVFLSILSKFENQQLLFLVVGTMLIARLWFKCTQVLSESVILFPSIGIQLETHRGLPAMCLSTTRQFIPLALLHDMVINEGLKGWDVFCYLATVRYVTKNRFGLSIAFENTLPPHAVLLHVYHGVHSGLLEK